MIKRVSPGLLAAFLVAAPASAQVTIEHKAVGCIVAGKFPKMNACFAPAGQLAKGRVYFREQATPTWYYVDMKSDAPCHSGVLPKPSKSLVGKNIEYYVEGQDRAFGAGRTSEFAPIVVASEGECRKDIPIAPISAAGPGAVFPAVPVGFASTSAISATTAAIVVAGAGAATVGTAVALNQGGGDTTTTSLTSNVTTPTTATTLPQPSPSPSTSPSPSPTSNRPPNAIFRVNPSPPTGTTPLTVSFNMCRSTDPDNDPLFFKIDFGDGSRIPYGTSCGFDHTYNARFLRGAASTPAQTFSAENCLTDNHFERCHVFTVDVAAGCALDTGPPSVAVTRPANNGQFAFFSTVPGEATASDSSGIASVQFILLKDGSSYCDGSGPYTQIDQQPGSGGPNYTASLNAGASGSCDFSFPPNGQFFKLKAVATDACGNSSQSESTFRRSFYGSGYPIRGVRRTTLSSELEVEGGQGQVVINGTSAFLPGSGRALTVANTTAGENRVEALLVDAAGREGLWRFELLSAESIVPGSLRVIAGDVAVVTDTAVTFRLRGRPGERVVFTFERR